jgi:hypothetical protein
VSRRWRLGPCPKCGYVSWEQQLTPRRPIRCANCPELLDQTADSPVGYSLDPRLAAAVEEGIGPVILTGRVLRRLTGSGFQWVPGIKYERHGNKGDIDIIASCDGYLVVVECKDRENGTAGEGMWAHFKELLDVALACRADLAVLATLAEEIPQDWVQRAESIAGEAFNVLFLDRADLDAGRVICLGDPDERGPPLSINQLVRRGPVKRLYPAGTVGKRTLICDGMSYCYGGDDPPAVKAGG